MLVQFVAIEEIPDYEAGGWVVVNDLSDSHHGRNGVMMEKYQTPDLTWFREPCNAVDACELVVIHGGKEIVLSLTAERAAIMLEDLTKYLSRHVRKHG